MISRSTVDSFSAGKKLLRKYFPKGSTVSVVVNRGPRGQRNQRVYVLGVNSKNQIEELSGNVAAACGYSLHEAGGLWCQDVENIAGNLGIALYSNAAALRTRVLN